jgi:hypothetical protein
MQEHATSMAGKLVVWSEVSAGTEVELRLPAHVAYKRANGGGLRTVGAGLRAVLRRRARAR